MTNQERAKERNHWESVIRRYNLLSNRRALTSDERQQRHLAQSKIDALYEKPVCVYPNCGCSSEAHCISYPAKTEFM